MAAASTIRWHADVLQLHHRRQLGRRRRRHRRDGSLTVTNSTIANNLVTFGLKEFATAAASSTTGHADGHQLHHRQQLGDPRYGGGIDNQGTLTVTNTTIADNSAGENAA